MGDFLKIQLAKDIGGDLGNLKNCPFCGGDNIAYGNMILPLVCAGKSFALAAWQRSILAMLGSVKQWLACGTIGQTKKTRPVPAGTGDERKRN